MSIYVCIIERPGNVCKWTITGAFKLPVVCLNLRILYGENLEFCLKLFEAWYPVRFAASLYL